MIYKDFIGDSGVYSAIFAIEGVKDKLPLKANKSGIFKSYSCRSLQAIIDKIEECKSKIESIQENIVDYQNEICELNNSISNLDYNISTTTNEILQLLK